MKIQDARPINSDIVLEQCNYKMSDTEKWYCFYSWGNEEDMTKSGNSTRVAVWRKKNEQPKLDPIMEAYMINSIYDLSAE